MKNLEGLNMKELTQKELLNVEGGSWFSRQAEAVGNALQSAYEWCKDTLHVDVEMGRR